MEVEPPLAPPTPREPTVILPEGPAPAPSAGPAWNMELAGRDVAEALGKLRDDVGYWVQKGRYNKVRLTRDGKQVLPDIPVGAIMAVEVAGLAWAGVLRTALVNVAGRLLFRVELINDAAEHLVAARDHYVRGDLDEAEAETVRALKVDPRLADGFLLLGTLAKVRGKPDEALRHFQRAHDLDPHGEIGRQAETQARKLDGGGGPPAADKS